MARADFPEQLGQKFRNSLTNVSPYEVPAIIWGFIEQYFVQKYNVQVAHARPQEDVQRPTIVWQTFKRLPGGGGRDRALNSRGPNFSHVESLDTSGLFTTIHTQHHTVYYEYRVYGVSNEEIDKIAWDLENALWQVIGLIQKEVPGFHMAFDQQLSDSDMSFKGQDTLMSRTIRWEAIVPVRYTELVEELRRVQIDIAIGAEIRTAIKFLRTSSSLRFDIPVESGSTLMRVYSITLSSGRNLKQLVEGIDYQVLVDTDTGIPYVSWIELGLNPAVNQEFRVDYEVGRSSERLTLNT